MLTIAPHYEGKISIPSPEVTQLMLDALDVKPGERVLEIGTGSGYQTFRLQQTGAEVYSIELRPQFQPVGQFGKVHLRVGDGSLGLPDEAPYDAILASCGVSELPKAWMEQLTVDGMIVAPVGTPEVQRLVLFKSESFHVKPVRTLAYVRFMMMDDSPKPKPIKPVYKELGGSNGTI